jgi:hypothetical protein
VKREVEIYSRTDAPYVARRSVWYWAEFDGRACEETKDYAIALARAKALMAEHGACLIDRSDKGSGFLLSTLRQ